MKVPFRHLGPSPDETTRGTVDPDPRGYCLGVDGWRPHCAIGQIGCVGPQGGAYPSEQPAERWLPAGWVSACDVKVDA